MKLAAWPASLLLLWPALGLAQSAPPSSSLDPNATPAPLGVHVVDDAEPQPPLVPRSKDLLGGHVLLGAAVGPAWALGKLGSHVPAAHGLGTGIGFHADAGFGLSRSITLGAWGGFERYGDGDQCSSCSGNAFVVGPFVRYHLAQGLRFDPWLALGGAFRKLTFEIEDARQSYTGLEWLRLELGADYYVWSGLGIGPYGALSLSSYTKRPTAAGDIAVSTELSFGLRLLLDVPGR